MLFTQASFLLCFAALAIGAIWCAVAGARTENSSIGDTLQFRTFTFAGALFVVYAILGGGTYRGLERAFPQDPSIPYVAFAVGLGLGQAAIQAGWVRRICPRFQDLLTNARRATARSRRNRMEALAAELATETLGELVAKASVYPEAAAIRRKLRGKTPAQRIRVWAHFLADQRLSDGHPHPTRSRRWLETLVLPLVIGLIVQYLPVLWQVTQSVFASSK